MDAIEIILSAQVQKRWRVKPSGRASDPPVHWLGQWRVDFGEKPDRTSVALVTNTTTLYTFVFPGKELGKDHNFEKLFRLRLGFSLVDAPALEGRKSASISFTAGNPRGVVGSMNNMRQHMVWRAETAVGPMEEDEDDEDWINNMPFLSLPGIFPGKAFAQRLAETQLKPAQHPAQIGPHGLSDQWR